jgi:hypothetical protein
LSFSLLRFLFFFEHKLHLHITPSLIHISSEQSSEESFSLSPYSQTWLIYYNSIIRPSLCCFKSNFAGSPNHPLLVLSPLKRHLLPLIHTKVRCCNLQVLRTASSTAACARSCHQHHTGPLLVVPLHARPWLEKLTPDRSNFF